MNSKYFFIGMGIFFFGFGISNLARLADGLSQTSYSLRLIGGLLLVLAGVGMFIKGLLFKSKPNK